MGCWLSFPPSQVSFFGKKAQDRLYCTTKHPKSSVALETNQQRIPTSAVVDRFSFIVSEFSGLNAF